MQPYLDKFRYATPQEENQVLWTSLAELSGEPRTSANHHDRGFTLVNFLRDLP